MAKRKSAAAGGGPSTGLIVTLIFFILTTFVAGTLAYFGYADQEKMKADTKKAKDDAKGQTTFGERADAKRLVYRLAFGIADDEERKTFSTLLDSPTYYPDIVKEVENIVSPLGNVGFRWDKNGEKVTTDPKQSVLKVVNNLKNLADTASTSRDQAEEAQKQLDTAFKTKEAALKKQITELESQKAKLENDLTEAAKKKKSEFEGLVKDLSEKDQQLAAARNEAAQKAEDDRRALAGKEKEIAELLQKVKGYESRVLVGADLVERDTKKADLEKRDGNYVFLNRGSADLLRAQTTFSVLPPDAVWRTADEKGRLIKGEIEVIEVLGPNSSRAKIINERNPIRDPIRAKDQLFNVIWSPGQREQIAFAGIIDLNGDGIDDNKAFIQLIEKQGVSIDSYLDLETRTIKGKGMSISTKFLVLGPEVQLPEDFGRRFKENDPRILAMQDIQAKMNQMKSDANKLGVQVIEYRKFLTSIGVKPPEKANISYDSMVYTKKEDRDEMKKENADK